MDRACGWLLLALLLAACGEASPRLARNAVLVTLDTLRADHLGCYGYPRPISRSLDALAASADLYTRAVASSPWTVPSHASLFTGLDPFAHGAHSFRVRSRAFCGDRPARAGDGEIACENVYPLAERHATLAETLRDAGFATAAFSGNAAFLAPWLQLDQGFDVYQVRRAPAASTNAAAFRWLDEHRGRPFFLFLNYMDAHRPYHTAPIAGLLDPPAEQDEALAGELFERVLAGEPAPEGLARRVIDQYDTGIAHADTAVGVLLAVLRERGLYDDTLVVVTSDHGEYFGEHGLAEHSKDVYQEVLRIPLLVKRAGQRAPRRIDAPTSLAQLPALIASELASGSAAELRARFPRAPGSDTPLAESYYARSKDLLDPRWGARFDRVRRALYAWPHKLIHSSDGRHELYDLEADPAEAHDLAAARPELVAELAAKLEARLAEASAAPDPEPGRAPTPEDLEALRELGYVQ